MEFNSITIKIIVKTNMPKTGIICFDEDKGAYRMNVHAKPEKGEANKEILKFFKKEFKKDIKIISGKTSKQKLIRLL